MMFRLAMGLGKTVAELESLSHEEFVGWQAFWQLEPWGCLPADQRAEYQLQLFYSANSKAGSEVPRFLERDAASTRKPDPTPEQLEDDIRSYFAGRTIKKKPRKRKVKPDPSVSNENGGK